MSNKRRTGGVVDESIPAGALKLLVKLNQSELEAVGKTLGTYRQHLQQQAAYQSNATVRDRAKDVNSLIRKLMCHMADDTLRAYFDQHWGPSVANMVHKQSFATLWQVNVEQWLYRAISLSEEVAKTVPRGRTGRRTNWPRDVLLKSLSKVFDAAGLRGPKEKAKSVAEACGVKVRRK